MGDSRMIFHCQQLLHRHDQSGRCCPKWLRTCICTGTVKEFRTVSNINYCFDPCILYFLDETLNYLTLFSQVQLFQMENGIS